MDAKDLALLEFPHIREIIAGYCSFSLSQAAARALIPSSDFDEVRARLAESAEARQLLEEEPSLGISGIEDVSASVRAAARGKMLDPQTLNTVRVTLEVLRLLHAGVTRHADHLPALSGIASGITPCKALEKAIGEAVSPDGELLPNASPKLSSIRHSQRTRRAELVDKLQAYITSDAARRYIQEPIVTEREGRFVIAVKTEFRNEVKGIVHDVSNSGASLFVEPWQTLELGNALKELQIEEAREIERILGELSTSAGEAAEDIVRGLEAAAAIDLALAKARFARRFKATEAEIYLPGDSEPPVIRLDGARHPLLGDAAVPITLELGKAFSILVITGPNTGGKTVALKTIGLLCLMTQAGLPIPAASTSRLPLLDGVFADIGDEQSIQETLSTFGWHMSNIARILRTARDASLVVLDELGASTDPQEGSALARAILLHLLAGRSLAAATTHYTELKVFAHITPGLQNASFDFDPKTLTPTYHLTLGTPGGSNAIATAAHFGLPQDIIAGARGSLSQGAQQLETLLASLQSEKQRLEDLNKELGREKNAFERQNTALAAELKKLREEKKQLIQDARDGIVQEVAVLQKELKQAEAELKRQTSQAAIKNAREASRKVREGLNKGAFAQPVTEPAGAGDEIGIGDSVWLNEYDVKGKVTAINAESGQVEVTAGSLRFRVGRDSLSKVSGAQPQQAAVVRVHTPARTVPSELDLRGKRADEVEPLLDSYLSDAAVARRPWVRIIHGFGTGTVRNIVRDMAAHHPLVHSYRSAEPDEGGDGATVIELR